jgi:phosphopantetheine adenylyltransferase
LKDNQIHISTGGNKKILLAREDCISGSEMKNAKTAEDVAMICERLKHVEEYLEKLKKQVKSVFKET